MFGVEKNHLVNKYHWGKWISTCEWLKLGPYTSPGTKVNSKCLIHLKVIPKVLKLLEENTEVHLHNVGVAHDFVHITSEAQAIKRRLIIGLHQNLVLLCFKGSYHEVKRQPTVRMGKKFSQVIHLFLLYYVFFPILLRYNCHISLYKFKVPSIMMWHILWHDYHSKFS